MRLGLGQRLCCCDGPCWMATRFRTATLTADVGTDGDENCGKCDEFDGITLAPKDYDSVFGPREPDPCILTYIEPRVPNPPMGWGATPCAYNEAILRIRRDPEGRDEPGGTYPVANPYLNPDDDVEYEYVCFVTLRVGHFGASGAHYGIWTDTPFVTGNVYVLDWISESGPNRRCDWPDSIEIELHA